MASLLETAEKRPVNPFPPPVLVEKKQPPPPPPLVSKRSRSKPKFAPGTQAKFGALLVSAYESLTATMKNKVNVPVAWDRVAARLMAEKGTCLLCADESKAPVSNNWGVLMSHLEKQHGAVGFTISTAIESMRKALQAELTDPDAKVPSKIPMTTWPAAVTIEHANAATKGRIQNAYSNFMRQHGAELKDKEQPWNRGGKKKKKEEQNGEDVEDHDEE